MKRLEIFTGPVSAAKSEGALRIIRRLQRQRSTKNPGKKIQVVHVRPVQSKRSEEPEGFAQTKDGSLFPCVCIEDFLEIHEVLESCALDPDIIWLDEIHFWENGRREEFEYVPIVGEIIQKNLRPKYSIYISGIGASTELNPICPSMGYLLALADEIHHEKADCDFHDESGIGIATRSLYVGSGPKEGDVHLGGEESFRPACPECWTKYHALPPEEAKKYLQN